MVIENKTIKISFRVSKKEHSKIINKSKKANMKLSEYLRYTSLNKNITIIEDFKDFSKELKGLEKILIN